MCLNSRYLRDSEDRVDACLSFFYQLDRSTLARAKSNTVSDQGKRSGAFAFGAFPFSDRT